MFERLCRGLAAARPSRGRTWGVVLAITVGVVASPPVRAERLAGSRHSDTWSFGGFCRIRWNEDPTSFNSTVDPSMSTNEGSANWSHPVTGAHLLYSDGRFVWTDDGLPIASSLPGDPSSMHSTVIVPAPGSPDDVYVFAHGAGQTSHIGYQRFDLSDTPVAVGSVGSVALPTGQGREGMLAIQHANGSDYFVLVSGATSIFVVPVTTEGVGAATAVASGLNVWTSGWHLFAASHQGNRLAMSGNNGGEIAVWDFDRDTGELSGRVAINPAFSRYQYYGGAFSPDGSKLYFATLDEGNSGNGPSAFYQYDFDTGTFTALSTNSARYTHGDARLGPDGKLYVAGNEANLHVIDDPDLPGTSAGFHFDAVTLPPGCAVKLGLPQAVIYPDHCPYDTAKNEPGTCGCGVADTDSDSDEVADCHDGCAADPDKVEPGVCGCDVADTDTDGDEVLDCHDACPDVLANTSDGCPSDIAAGGAAGGGGVAGADDDGGDATGGTGTASGGTSTNGGTSAMNPDASVGGGGTSPDDASIPIVDSSVPGVDTADAGATQDDPPGGTGGGGCGCRAVPTNHSPALWVWAATLLGSAALRRRQRARRPAASMSARGCSGGDARHHRRARQSVRRVPAR